MKICLFKTKNGWLIHNESYFSTDDAENLTVFGSMKETCSYLLKIETPKVIQKRLPNGRFLSKPHLNSKSASI